ncbi:tyrosine-type recombinase/integrase [Spongisporangium articulatum]|uniref:Tyrosine-type recombinase/integrase n=1 Tax=Spongisporangium articulatum TaxID=3362603 RepID=A0ABW8AP42_9ACTN
MAKGSVSKRCQCRDADGKRVKDCRKAHGSWGYTVDAGRDQATGKRKQTTQGGFSTRREAEAAMHVVLSEIEDGSWSNDQGMTLGAWLDQWLEESGERLAVKTMISYTGHVRDVWKPLLGHMRLRAVRRHHVENAIREVAKPITGERPKGNVGQRVEKRSASTVAAYRRTLRAALAAAQRRGLITVNPAQGRMDSIPKAEHHEFTVWEPEQTARFLDHVSEDRLSALYEVAAYAGLRRAELCGLRWSDIDEGGAGITIGQTLIEVSSKAIRPEDRECKVCGGDHGGRLLKEPKSRAGRRWVPLVGAAQAALTAHRVMQLAERKPFGDDYADHDLVFCEVDGNPLRPGSLSRDFEAHIKACELPRIRLHDTRHGACSLLLSGGVPIEIVQMILGHSSPAITRQVYAHVLKKATALQVEAASEAVTKHRREQSVSKEAESAASLSESGKGGAES